MGFNTIVDQAILIFFVLCGLTRLARFNVAAGFVPRDDKGKPLYHEGLATAYAALVLMTAAAAGVWLNVVSDVLEASMVFAGSCFEFHSVMGAVVVMSFMMTSKRLHIYLDGGYSIPAATAVVIAGCWSIAPLPMIF